MVYFEEEEGEVEKTEGSGEETDEKTAE